MGEFKIPQELMDELDRGVFVSLNDKVLFEGDGIKSQPSVNFVEIKTDKLSSGDARFIEAVCLYFKIGLEIDALLGQYPKFSPEYYDFWFSTKQKAEAWACRYPDDLFFVIPEEEADDFKRLKTESLLGLCEAGNAHFVVMKWCSEFHDLVTGAVYELLCDEIPGQCDDAATYYEYSLTVTYPDDTTHVIWEECDR